MSAGTQSTSPFFHSLIALAPSSPNWESIVLLPFHSPPGVKRTTSSTGSDYLARKIRGGAPTWTPLLAVGTGPFARVGAMAQGRGSYALLLFRSVFGWCSISVEAFSSSPWIVAALLHSSSPLWKDCAGSALATAWAPRTRLLFAVLGTVQFRVWTGSLGFGVGRISLVVGGIIAWRIRGGGEFCRSEIGLCGGRIILML